MSDQAASAGAMDMSRHRLSGQERPFGLLAEPTELPSPAACVALSQPNQILFSRGDAGREIYVVLRGRILLSVLTTDGRELAFAHAGPGDIFGEIAALDGDERSAGATALTHAKVASLSHRAILDLIDGNPKLVLAAIGFWALDKWLKRNGEIIFNFVFVILSFATLLIPIGAKLPLTLTSPELFPGLAVPMHLFPALGWFTLKPLFIRQG